MNYLKLTVIMALMGGFLLWSGALPVHQPSVAHAQFDCHNVSGVSTLECQALISIYTNTDGYQWGDRYHSQGWLSNNQPCSWGGVLCRDGHVTGLNLILTGLRGPFPAAIANLSHLRVLNLSDNNLYGPIPSWVGKLRNLEVVALAGNLLTGPVPTSLTNLPRLRHLSLHNNFGLAGIIPFGLVNLSGMDNLTYDNTQLCAPNDEQFFRWILDLNYFTANELYCGAIPRPEFVPPPVVAPTIYDGPIVNVIRNGGFEAPGPQDIGVPPEWQRYSNGGAHFGWYDDQWDEVVYAGDHSQLLEIFQVFGDYPFRVIAIHQTVDVRPHSDYQLTMQVAMRSTARAEYRGNGTYAMDWGVDYTGRGDYNAVDFYSQWVNIEDLEEQRYLGSESGLSEISKPSEIPSLYIRFQKEEGIIHTGDSHRITLFIRGVKAFPTSTEVNFNIDEVSLIGPPP